MSQASVPISSDKAQAFETAKTLAEAEQIWNLARMQQHQEGMPPMLKQYVDYKMKHEDCLIFFQVGDFYELFFEDARVASAELNLTLTSRDKRAENPIPMCGVPLAVVDDYVTRLVERGFSCAIVSQFGERGKGMMDRELERIISPALRLGSKGESSEAGGVLAAFVTTDREIGTLAWVRVETGEIFVRERVNCSDLNAELGRSDVSELLLLDREGEGSIDRRLSWVRAAESLLSENCVKFRKESAFSQRILQGCRPEGFSQLEDEARAAVRLVYDFLDEALLEPSVLLKLVRFDDDQGLLLIDPTTRRNLELFETQRTRARSGSLMSFLAGTRSAGGARKLESWLLRPSSSIQEISARHDAVEYLFQRPELTAKLQGSLSLVADLERVAARIELGICQPNELLGLRSTLSAFSELQEEFSFSELGLLEPSELARLSLKAEEVQLSLDSALHDSVPRSIVAGGVFREGFDAELDRLRGIRAGARAWLSEYEASQRESSGIQSLKLRFNNVLGYFLEVTKANLSKVPEHYIQRQTMVNAVRFTTEELKSRESDILGAEEKSIARETELYEQLRAELKPACPEFRELAELLSKLDVFVNFASLSRRFDFVRPQMTEGRELKLEEARHPVLQATLMERFVPNSAEFDPEGNFLFVVTGPNMGGKSTFLRQTALNVILAQMGCFVAAKAAQIGVVDQIFARLGASDNLIEGESTFMVEMKEAAFMVARATERSLVLVDEIGRGTATSDGFAIARAILEWLAKEARSRAVFATHFHMLTALAEELPGVSNLRLGAVEQDGEILFSHRVETGPADRSYGVEVAKLAGLPQPLVQRAAALLESFGGNEEELHRSAPAAQKQLGLFASPAQPSSEKSPWLREARKFLASLRDRDLNEMRPIDALLLLLEMQETVEREFSEHLAD